jgi:hypothetical protein
VYKRNWYKRFNKTALKKYIGEIYNSVAMKINRESLEEEELRNDLSDNSELEDIKHL